MCACVLIYLFTNYQINQCIVQIVFKRLSQERYTVLKDKVSLLRFINITELIAQKSLQKIGG